MSAISLKPPKVIPEESYSKQRPRMSLEGTKKDKLHPLNRIQAVFSHVCLFLKREEMISFDSSCKQLEKLTDLSWKDLRKKDYFNFDWADCNQEKCYNKWNYALGAALVLYIDKRKDSVSKKEGLFKGLMNRFPHFGCFLREDMRIFDKSKEIFKEKISQASKGGWGGEILLEGLFLAKDKAKKPSESLTNLISAIQREATYASLLVEKVCSKPMTPLEVRQLAIEAARVKDFRALENWCTHASLEDLRKMQAEGHLFAPLFYYLSEHVEDLEAKESLLNNSLIQYQDTEKRLDRAPAYVLAQMGVVKASLNKNEGAEFFLARAIKLYGPNIPPQVLADMGVVKTRLNHYIEADSFFEQALKLHDEKNIPASLLANAGAAKLRVNNDKEALFLLNRAIDLYGKKDIPPDVLSNAGIANFRFNKNRKAEFLLKRSIELYGTRVPACVLLNMGCVKSRLKKGEEAIYFLDQAVKLYGINIPSQISVCIAQIKNSLKKK